MLTPKEDITQWLTILALINENLDLFHFLTGSVPLFKIGLSLVVVVMFQCSSFFNKKINIYILHITHTYIYTEPRNNKKMELWFIPCDSKDSAILKTGTKLDHNHFLQLI